MAERTREGEADHYEVLRVRPDASLEEIKHSYHKLALLLHPDRAPSPSPSTSAPAPQTPCPGREELSFQDIQRAWLTLSDADARATYDAWRKGQEVEAHPVAGEMDLDDMQFDEATSSYSARCRCGSTYCITEEELDRGIDLVACGGCSFATRILYTTEEEEAQENVKE